MSKIDKFDFFNTGLTKGQYSKEGIELHYWAFDWDDNILHMPTKINMDQKVADKWLPIEVSTADFAEVRHDIENYRIRNNNAVEAFCQFGDEGPRGKSAFLEDVKLSLSKGDFGPVWNEFKQCLMDGSIFAIITARGHEPETIREAVEYVIDTQLTDDEKYLMYIKCLEHAQRFSDPEVESYERIPKGLISKTNLIKNWLDNCDFYGVSSKSFASAIGSGSATSPEKAKLMALNVFIKKCNDFAVKIGAKSVSIGFSDDDPKNVEHVRVFFKEKSALSDELSHLMKLNLFKTTDRTKKGGERTKFIGGEELKESSHQAWGTESSVVPFSKFNNTTNFNYPNTKDLPKDDQHHMLKLKTGQTISLYKDFGWNRKKHIRKK